MGEHLTKARKRDPKTGKNQVRIRDLAEFLGVHERTLRNWRRRASGGTSRPIGRPRHGVETHRRAFFAVGRELIRQGYPGWRKISAALGPGIPTGLVQEYVGRFKALKRRRYERRRKRTRVSTEVLATNAVWSQDATHLGRAPEGQAQGEVLKDRGSIRTIGAQVGPPSGGAEVVKILEMAKEARGLPLVLSTDNGSQYRNEELAGYLEREQVIHLYSLPRTPQHNGAAEIQIRGLKELAGLGKGVKLESLQEAAVKLEKAAACIDETRPVLSRNLKTARELDDTMPRVGLEIRESFFTRCQARMRRAVASTSTWRAARLAEREAVFFTLEEFGLVRRTQGGRPYVAPKAEIFS